MSSPTTPGEHPDVALEINCGLSRLILERMRADDLDLVIAMVDADRTQYLSRSWIERPIWAGAREARIEVVAAGFGSPRIPMAAPTAPE